MYAGARGIILHPGLLFHLQKFGVLLVYLHTEIKVGIPCPDVRFVKYRAGVDERFLFHPLRDPVQLGLFPEQGIVFLRIGTKNAGPLGQFVRPHALAGILDHLLREVSAEDRATFERVLAIALEEGKKLRAEQAQGAGK